LRYLHLNITRSRLTFLGHVTSSIINHSILTCSETIHKRKHHISRIWYLRLWCFGFRKVHLCVCRLACWPQRDAVDRVH